MQIEPWMFLLVAVFVLYLYFLRTRKKYVINFLTLHTFLANDNHRKVEDITNDGPLGSKTLLFSHEDEHVRYTRSSIGTALIESLRVARNGEPTFKATFRDEKLVTFERSDTIEDTVGKLTPQATAALLSLLYRFREYANKH